MKKEISIGPTDTDLPSYLTSRSYKKYFPSRKEKEVDEVTCSSQRFRLPAASVLREWNCDFNVTSNYFAYLNTQEW